MRTLRNLYLTTIPSNASQQSNTVEDNPIVMSFQPGASPYKNACKDKLKQLNEITSPKQLFFDIDTLFLSYSAIKRQYSSSWQTHELYKQKIRSFLKDNRSATMSISLQEIDIFINNLHQLHISINKWFQKLMSETNKILRKNSIIDDIDNNKNNNSNVNDMSRVSSASNISDDREQTRVPRVSKQTSVPVAHAELKKLRKRNKKKRSKKKLIQHRTKAFKPAPVHTKSHAKRMSQSFTNTNTKTNTNSQKNKIKNSKKVNKSNGNGKNGKNGIQKGKGTGKYEPKINIKKRGGNIRPTHAKQLSMDLGNKKKKKKLKKKKNKIKGRPRSNTSGDNQIPPNLPHIDVTSKSYSNLRKGHGKGNVNVNVSIDSSNSSNSNTLSISTNLSNISTPKSSNNSNSNVSIPSSPRGDPRTFGEIFSKDFQSMTAQNYAKNKTLATIIDDDDDAKNNDFKYKSTPKQLKMVQYYHNACYGQSELFESPFGVRPLIYCDWNSSGKSLKCIEYYISSEMLPLYATTHSTASMTAMQTSRYRSEARSIILESVQGDINDDVVLFCGSSATDSIYKMAHVLYKSMISNNISPKECIVFISVYETESNVYIWKEMGYKIIIIPSCNVTKSCIDLKVLEMHLKFYTSKQMKIKHKLLIASFTAASNISGIIAPVDETTALLHKYGALSFWDYSTAGASMDIYMTNKQNNIYSKDAVFISVHKYLGGPGSPGVLIAKKKLFTNPIPVVPGNGSMFLSYGIENNQYEYLDNICEREEGNSPNIIGSIRASLCFMVKDYLSTQFIENRENNYLNYFIRETKNLSNLVIMGDVVDPDCPQLPIISLLITHTKKKFGNHKTKYLHHNFIAALMNDLFGIQGRGGCANSGMYAMKTLQITDEEMIYAKQQIRNKNELARPGFYRINLHYTLNKEELKYIVRAIQYICEKGWYFLPLYDIDAATGNYYHRDTKKKPNLIRKQLRSLLDISFDENLNGKMVWKKKQKKINDKSLKDNLNKFFKMADNIFFNLEQLLTFSFNNNQFKNEQQINDDNSWYWLPSELYDDVLAAFKNNNI